ncbi:hypothetical protein [Nakamurella aerolata]|uniref:Uncharacterized protein n=1 Tax=Nakamurella aerolata TaxID=1656892 RepID=A0A849A6U5_9ACTN|nr:hypothetical protein [Nakamurella aerolata]NNG35183.1 hypothetical protein [Nakamurella aerolata]
MSENRYAAKETDAQYSPDAHEARNGREWPGMAGNGQESVERAECAGRVERQPRRAMQRATQRRDATKRRDDRVPSNGCARCGRRLSKLTVPVTQVPVMQVPVTEI